MGVALTYLANLCAILARDVTLVLPYTIFVTIIKWLFI